MRIKLILFIVCLLIPISLFSNQKFLKSADSTVSLFNVFKFSKTKDIDFIKKSKDGSYLAIAGIPLAIIGFAGEFGGGFLYGYYYVLSRLAVINRKLDTLPVGYPLEIGAGISLMVIGTLFFMGGLAMIITGTILYLYYKRKASKIKISSSMSSENKNISYGIRISL